jgi:ATP-dependent helicase/nuclease subunit B
LPAEEFQVLQEQITAHLRAHGRQIFAGATEVTPFRKGRETACERCDFLPVCRFDAWTQPFRVLRPPPKPVEPDEPAPDARPKGKRR